MDFIQTPIVSEILRAKVRVFIELHRKTKKIEEQSAILQNQLTKLTEANAELEAFTYSLSHDLRAPLRAIHGLTRVVLEDHAQNIEEEGKNFLKRVINAGHRMERLMEDLLNFSRVSRGELRCEPLDVEKLLHEIIDEQPNLQPPKAQLRIQSPLLAMRGDRASMTQCLANLLSNAVKFVPDGVVPQVSISSQKIDDRVRLWVNDNGIGIPREAHLKIFEIFQRIPQKATCEGKGIGLAIVRKALERMGGDVGVESEPGKGSRFWVELPDGKA